MFGDESFTIATLLRTDVARAGLTEDQIKELTNLDMVSLASRLGRLYFESSFLSHLQQAVNDLLMEKEEQSYPIASISRAELTRVGYSEQEIALLTDTDLEKIAQLMWERYGHRLYEADLLQLAGIVISEKEQTNAQTR